MDPLAVAICIVVVLILLYVFPPARACLRQVAPWAALLGGGLLAGALLAGGGGVSGGGEEGPRGRGRRPHPRGGPGDAPRVFTMYVQDPWFTEIAEGRKTVEGRVGSGEQLERFQGRVGQLIEVAGPDGQRLSVKVAGVRHHPDLKTYLKEEGWKKTAPQAGSEAKAKAAYDEIMMRRDGKEIPVFGAERVKERGGVIAVELEFVGRLPKVARGGALHEDDTDGDGMRAALDDEDDMRSTFADTNLRDWGAADSLGE